jgi:hypothetical protein
MFDPIDVIRLLGDVRLGGGGVRGAAKICFLYASGPENVLVDRINFI